MKNMKNISKRGLSLFLALVMCLGMLQITAFAAEDHTHSEGGWTCTQAEGTKELTCDKHVHTGDCYRSVRGELTCEAEEHTHGDGCTETKSEQTCTDGEHAHSGDCYDEEDNLTCGAEEHIHSHDCFTTETVTICTQTEHEHGDSCYVVETEKLCAVEEDHTHSDECYTVTEGVWNCEAPKAEKPTPVEGTKAEEPTANTPDEGEMMTVQWVKGYGSATSATIGHITVAVNGDYSGACPANPVREGYTFTGWSEPEESTAGDGQKVITITAQWEKVPAKPAESDLPTTNQRGYVYVKCVTYPNSNPRNTSQRKHAGCMSLANSTGGWSFGEVYANDGRYDSDGVTAEEYPWFCDLTVDQEWYLKVWNSNYSPKEGTHYVADASKAVVTTFVWSSDDEKWLFFTEDFPLTVWITHNVPTTYRVDREYWINGEKVATVTGTEETDVAGKTLVYKDLAEANPDWRTYQFEGEDESWTFDYVVSDPAGKKLETNSSKNVIRLKYELVKDDNTCILTYYDNYQTLSRPYKKGSTVTVRADYLHNPSYNSHKIFAGWKKAGSNALVYDVQSGSDMTFVIEEDTTLYAVWGKNITYSLSYNAKYAENVPETQSMTLHEARADGYTFTIPETVPTRIGCEFVCWKTYRGDNVWDVYYPEENVTVAKSRSGDMSMVTLMPEWRLKEAESGKIMVSWILIPDSIDVFIKQVNIDSGEDYSSYQPDDPVRTGWCFLGWKTPETDENGNITIRAKWDVDRDPNAAWLNWKIIVTWKDGYTDNPIKVETVIKGTTYQELEDIYPSNPTRQGYKFNGWGEPETNEDGNITITAKWKKDEGGDKPDPEEEKITAAWLPGYGSNEPIQTKEYDKGTTSVPAGDYPANPTRSGYTFTDWSAPVIGEDGNITITAQWRRNSTGGGRTPTPTPDPDPIVDIPDEEPPLAEEPNVDVDIPDEEPPLVDIPDVDVPLDDTPKTGDSGRTALWAGMCAVSLTGVVILSRKKEDEEA